jgi:hypothetical protein
MQDRFALGDNFVTGTFIELAPYLGLTQNQSLCVVIVQALNIVPSELFRGI